MKHSKGGLESVTRTSIVMVLTIKWVSFQFWVTCPIEESLVKNENKFGFCIKQYKMHLQL